MNPCGCASGKISLKRLSQMNNDPNQIRQDAFGTRMFSRVILFVSDLERDPEKFFS